MHENTFKESTTVNGGIHNGGVNSGNSPEDPRFEASAQQPQPLTPSEDRQWATIAHFGAILGCIPSGIIHYVFRERGPFTAQESKEAFNFTLPPTILAIVANLLSMIPFVGGFFAVIAVLLWLFLTINGVIAGIEVNKGRPYRYRFNLRLID
ncbi:hypothetical protein HD598_000643 [Neomicrococcus aestuarii]|uniref:DUF4870 domain-containing protein n=1 Tax=Neomicrococcus aestuarii TaxID=556325 RepID=A0A7W8WY52_9MICC|nr:DUF4870 domain-containing protein [Neomicrococcus aestuarii]MBB5511956.1 hypothetical protein [Neomicrococcus aestuarii]